MLCHNFGERKISHKVIFIIKHRLFAGFADCLKSGKMNGGVDIVLAKYLIQKRLVAAVALIELDLFAGDLLHPLDALDRTVDEIVEDDYFVTFFQQKNVSVTGDVSGSAGDENFHYLALRKFY